MNNATRQPVDCPLPVQQLTFGDAYFQVQIDTPATDAMTDHGQRFDTLGRITTVLFQGQAFLGWPGLVDEFGIAETPGYAAAKPGQTFLKMGIGEFTRLDDKPYQFSRPYPIARWAAVEVQQGEGRVRFRQNFTGTGGWAYDYHKTYRINAAEARLEINYQLTNTGTHLLETDQYNHNFFSFGGNEVSPLYALELGFAADPAEPTWFKRLGNRMDDFRPAAQGSYFPSPQGAPAADNHFRLGHRGTGLAVRVEGDYEISRFALWANRFLISPEVFIKIHLAPGQTQQWQRRYHFGESQAKRE